MLGVFHWLLLFQLVIESSFHSMGLFIGSPLWFSIGCFAYKINNPFHFWCMLGGSAWIWMKSNLVLFIESQIHLSTYGIFCSNFLSATSKHAPKNFPNLEGIDCKTTNSQLNFPLETLMDKCILRVWGFRLERLPNMEYHLKTGLHDDLTLFKLLVIVNANTFLLATLANVIFGVSRQCQQQCGTGW